MPIKYLKGDATDPQGEGVKIIAHVCNDVGGWGRGFVMALSEKWKLPETTYRQAYDKREIGLSDVQFIDVGNDLMVANMVAQRDIRWAAGKPPIRYTALGNCLDKVVSKAHSMNATIHVPRIGCGLAGGEWSKVEKLIAKSLGNVDDSVDVFVYDLE